MHRTFLQGFPLFIWFCLPSLRCLISALMQVGGGDLLCRFGSTVQSSCGEGDALQVDVAAYGEHSPCSGRAVSSFGVSPWVLCASSLRCERLGQPDAWSPLHGLAAPPPSAAPARAAGRVSGSLQTGPGACLPGGRGWLLWG